MNEAEFLVFQKITAIIETLIYGCGLATFFSPFMKRNRGKKYTPSGKYDKLFIIFIVYCAVYFAGIIVSISNWICMLAVILLLLALPHALGIERKIIVLLAILFFSIRGLSRLMMESVYFLINQFFVLKKKRTARHFTQYGSQLFRLRPASVCFIFYITIYYGTQITEKASSALRKRTVLSVPDPGHWIFIWKPDLRHVF